MSGWSYKNVGSSCNMSNRLLMKQLLESCGVDCEQPWIGSEAGEIYLDEFNPKIKGPFTDGNITPLEIYQIANDLFDNISIYYEFEDENNTSDDYYRYEEIYNPLTCEKLIGEKNYSYGENLVFDESPYKLLKNEIEEEANKEDIAISWDDDYPDEENEEFYNLCENILNKHGGLEVLGTRKSSEKIEKTNINPKKLQNIVNKAGEYCYKGLVELLENKYQIKVKKLNTEGSHSVQLYNDNEIKSAYLALKRFSNPLSLGTTTLWIPHEGKYTSQAEILKKGDEVILEHVENVEGLNLEEGTIAVKFNNNIIGFMKSNDLAVLLDCKRFKFSAYIDEVTPLSQRSKRCTTPIINIKFTYEEI